MTINCNGYSFHRPNRQKITPIELVSPGIERLPPIGGVVPRALGKEIVGHIERIVQGHKPRAAVDLPDDELARRLTALGALEQADGTVDGVQPLALISVVKGASAPQIVQRAAPVHLVFERPILLLGHLHAVNQIYPRRDALVYHPGQLMQRPHGPVGKETDDAYRGIVLDQAPPVLAMRKENDGIAAVRVRRLPAVGKDRGPVRVVPHLDRIGGDRVGSSGIEPDRRVAISEHELSRTPSAHIEHPRKTHAAANELAVEFAVHIGRSPVQPDILVELCKIGPIGLRGVGGDRRSPLALRRHVCPCRRQRGSQG